MTTAIRSFAGMAPKVDSSKLRGEGAQYALDCELWSGALRAITQPGNITTPTKPGTIRSIYKLDTLWLHWTEEVDVVESPVGSDIYERIYYSGAGVPCVTNATLAASGSGTDYPLDFYQLGTPVPETSPSIAVTGGVGSNVTRSYLYTFVTQWGEEGAPCVATTFTGKDDGSWDLSNMDVAPLNVGTISAATHSGGVVTVSCTANHLLRTGEYLSHSDVVGMTDLNGRFKVTRINSTQYSVLLTTAQTYTSGGTWTREAKFNTSNMTKRIYRTVGGIYKFVAEIAVGTTTYSDTIVDSSVGTTITSTNYDMPPAEMSGIISMPNGILVGFVNNEICFTEPYLPHAWPENYRINTDTNIVAIASWGIEVIIGTTKHPYRVTGVHPSAMSKSKIERDQSCISKESMQVLNAGVCYASPDGLVYISSGGAQLITNAFVKKDEWSLYAPSSMRAGIYDNRYYVWYEGGGKLNNENAGIVFDPEESGAEFVLLSSQATGVWSSKIDDRLYIVEAGVIKEWAAGAIEYTSTWKSKEFFPARKASYACAKVHIELINSIPQSQYDAAFSAAIQAVDDGYSNNTLVETGELNGFMANQFTVNGGPYYAAISDLGTPSSVTIKFYQDRVLIHTEQVEDQVPFRINQVGWGDSFEFEISGTQAIIRSLVVAESMSQLELA